MQENCSDSATPSKPAVAKMLVRWLSDPLNLDWKELNLCIEALLSESLERFDGLGSEAVQMRDESGHDCPMQGENLSPSVSSAVRHGLHLVR